MCVCSARAPQQLGEVPIKLCTSLQPHPPLRQALDPSAAQLSAATLALINTLIARQGHARGLVKLAQTFSFARWGLEGYVIAESNRLTVRAGCSRRAGWEQLLRSILNIS